MTVRQIDELQQRLEQVRARAISFLRMRTRRFGSRVVEASRVGLRSYDATIEIDVVPRFSLLKSLWSRNSISVATPYCGCGLCIEDQVFWRAGDRHDAVPVGSAGLGGIITPLERLNRVIRGDNRRTWRQSPVLITESDLMLLTQYFSISLPSLNSVRSIANPISPLSLGFLSRAGKSQARSND